MRTLEALNPGTAAAEAAVDSFDEQQRKSLGLAVAPDDDLAEAAAVAISMSCSCSRGAARPHAEHAQANVLLEMTHFGHVR